MNCEESGGGHGLQFPIAFIVDGVCNFVSDRVPEVRRSDPHFRETDARAGYCRGPRSGSEQWKGCPGWKRRHSLKQPRGRD